MPPHLIFFLGTLSFLSGVVFASMGLSLLLSALPAAVVCAVLFASNVDARIALLAAFLLVAGNAFYLQDDYRYHTAIAAVPSAGKFQGTIVEDPKRELDYQSFYLKTDFGKMAVQTIPEPAYSYGETVAVEGKIQTPSQNYTSQHVVGVLRNPHITLISKGGGNLVLAYLFGLKGRMYVSYQRVLSPDQAALLYGVMFGANDHIPKQLADNLEVSGLRFITAIDGLHMQIMILIFFGACAYSLPRKYAFLLTFFFVVLFVALTGFTISGVRASLMAFLAGIARETKRVYLPYMILSFTALVLALINPKALVFDVGFQLSFLAVLSIVYFLPVLRGLLRLSDDPGVLGWKESLLITISVQLATAPVVISQFQTFSLTSLVAGVLVVWMLPFILALGLFLALSSLVSHLPALLLSFIIAPMIDYVLLIVNAFAGVAVLFNPNLGFIGTVLYYGALILVMYWFYGRQEKASAKVQSVPEKTLEATHISKEAASYEIIEIE